MSFVPFVSNRPHNPTRQRSQRAILAQRSGMGNPHTAILCHIGSKTARDGPVGRPSHCWLVTFFCAIILRVKRSPSTVSW